MRSFTSTTSDVSSLYQTPEVFMSDSSFEEYEEYYDSSFEVDDEEINGIDEILEEETGPPTKVSTPATSA